MKDPKPPQPSKMSSVLAFAGPFALRGGRPAPKRNHPAPSLTQQEGRGSALPGRSPAPRGLRGTCPPCATTSARPRAPGEKWELRAGRR